jgi:hypothetical protein
MSKPKGMTYEEYDDYLEAMVDFFRDEENQDPIDETCVDLHTPHSTAA